MEPEVVIVELMAEGDGLMANGVYGQVSGVYSEILSLDPENDEAQKKFILEASKFPEMM